MPYFAKSPYIAPSEMAPCVLQDGSISEGVILPPFFFDFNFIFGLLINTFFRIAPSQFN